MSDIRNTVPEILHSELSYEIVGAAMDVHNELGPGWDEESYHRAMLHAFKERGVQAKSKLRGELNHQGIIADQFELDILVEGLVVLELKHLVGPFAPSHRCQLINYLKLWGKDLGILINFGLDRLKCERIPYSPVAGITHHEGSPNKLTAEDDSLSLIFSILDAISKKHGLGYGTKTYSRLFVAECKFQAIDHKFPFVDLTYKNHPLGNKQVEAVLVHQESLVLVTALSERSTAVDLSRLLAYMKQMNISKGVLVNFGKTTLTIRPLIL